MHSIYELLRAFVSSPNDVSEERGVVERVIKAVSITCKEALGIELECVSWDEFVPQTPKLPEESIQDILNAEIPKCEIFILIFGSDMVPLNREKRNRIPREKRKLL